MRIIRHDIKGEYSYFDFQKGQTAMKNMVFHRLFAKSMYKNLKLPLGEMTFTKNFVNDNCGDLYPVINKSPECNEIIENNIYSIISGAVERMAGQFFPYASYEIDCLLSGGKCGFAFYIPNGKAAIICSEDRITFSENGKDISFKNKSFCKNIRMVITCRPKAFDVYLFSNGKPEYFHTFSSDIFNADCKVK